MDFTKAKELAEKKATDYVGKPKKDCPKQKTCLIVVVYKQDTNEVIKSAKVQVAGTGTDKKGKAVQKSKNEKTDGKGIAKFKPWDPGNYTVDISIPSTDGYENPVLSHQSIGLGTCPVICIPVKPLPKVKVKVVQKGDHSRVFSDAIVNLVSSPQKHSDKKTKAGIADFGRTQSGKYVFQVTALKEEDRKEFALPKAQVEETLSSGDDKTVTIEVEKINVVTPKIEMEYKVVLFDRGLSKYQEATEEKIYPDPTYIQLSFRQTDASKPFQKGGKVKFSPANVDVFLDEECKKKAQGDPASGIDLKHEEISNLSGHNLYLRGKTVGKFKVIFELTDPQNALIRLDKNPAEEEMGVVEIQMRVFEHDATELAKIKIDPDTDPIATYHTNLKNQELPKPVLLTTEKKVKVGRLLHAQKNNSFSRAKMVIKINPDEWPSGTDAYKIVFDKEKTSGDVEVFDAEWEGDVRGSLNVSSLKSNKEQAFWLQGKTITTKWRDVRFYLNLDRVEGGLPKKPKRNADWARFTVVEITEVKVHYEPEVGKAVAWDEGEKRFYINFKDDQEGRKVTISAKLSQPLKDAKIHFMLAPDKENMKQANWGIALPGTWKWKDLDAALKHKDKNDRKDLLHLSEKTDENGLAKKELVLSRFGGDKYVPAAYIDQDPHLAKYVHGHTDLEKKKPALASDGITVWRKFWYQMTFAEGFDPPDPAAAEAAYLSCKADLKKSNTVKFQKASVPARTYYERWMVKPNSGNDEVALIGNHNKGHFYGLFVADKIADNIDRQADKPAKGHLVICEYQWDPEGPSDLKAVSIGSSPSDWITMSKPIITPALGGGGLVVQGEWSTPPGASPPRNGVLSDGDIIIDQSRDSNRKVKVRLPAGAPVPTNANPINVTLILECAKGYLGESSGNGQIMIVYKSSDVPDYNDTVAHELAHSLSQTQNAVVETIPAHPNWDDLGQGVHCLKKKCIMYKSGPQAEAEHIFCEDCHPYLVVQNMSSLQ